MVFFLHVGLYFAGGKTPDVGSRTYTEIMKEQYLRAEETEVKLKYQFTVHFRIF